ncbi:hypothetical protein PRECH8_04510 [Insulibacter thermoxylanivorax]|uniref:Uncharacterized protein n=1 Tax=Insulibacter thermoxylanivorax TaxID=2749268 RepID=A0A916QAL5_9BACL|nr:hypothetical protein PRECH8_04510 [Insulibacter thermoxylanivorax]
MLTALLEPTAEGMKDLMYCKAFQQANLYMQTLLDLIIYSSICSKRRPAR